MLLRCYRRYRRASVHQLLQGSGNVMSEVLWCDQGQHPFAAGKDNDEETFLSNKANPDGTPRKRRDVCGPCARKSAEKESMALGASTVDKSSDD
jgi:hypothetical protein